LAGPAADEADRRLEKLAEQARWAITQVQALLNHASIETSVRYFRAGPIEQPQWWGLRSSSSGPLGRDYVRHGPFPACSVPANRPMSSRNVVSAA
jgi:hypothetical protein